MIEPTAMNSTDFARTRAFFHLPDDIIYLNGNSLGPLPTGVRNRISNTIEDEWGALLGTAWNKTDWIDRPAQAGDRIAALIGAEPGTVTTGDTLSVKVFQALASALRFRPGRRTVLTDSGNFPSDLYMAQGCIDMLSQGHELKRVEPEAVQDHLDEDVAVLLLTEVDYRTGRRHDMQELTRLAHSVGALAIWDLAHSIGVLPIDVAAAKADFAVGCTYKYLNGGPGAPAFIYVAPGYADTVDTALPGWLGHAAPFGFESHYRPHSGIGRMRIGTPPILALTVLLEALEVWNFARIEDVRHRSIALTERFIDRVENSCPSVILRSPRDARLRGSQVAFAHPEGREIISRLVSKGVIADFREPDIMRFGISPLYNTKDDIDRAATEIASAVAAS